MKDLLSFQPVFMRHRGALLLALALSLFTLVAGILLLSVSGWFLTAAFLAGSAGMLAAFGPSMLVGGVSLLRIAARYGERMSGHDATLKIVTDLRLWLFTRLVPRAGALGQGMRRGDVIQRLTADVDALDVVFLLAIGPMVTALLAGTAFATLLWFVLPMAAGLYACAFLAAALGVPMALAAATRAPGHEAVAAMTHLRIATLDGIDGRAELAAFGGEARFMAQFDAAAETLSRIRLRIAGRAACAQALVQALTGLALVLVLIPGIAAVGEGRIGGATLAGLLLGVIGTFEATAGITRSVARLGIAQSAAGRLQALAAPVAESHVPSCPGSPESPPVPCPGQAMPHGALQFDGVVAGHAGAPSIGPLDFTVPAGSIIALRGPSGSGKSTVLGSLLGLVPLRQGAIRIGGVSIEAVDDDTLYARVALLEQNAPIFMGTVRENLMLADPAAGDDRLWTALAHARLDSAIRALPDGLETQVGEAGHTLSVGEGRRLALARMLLTPATILLLDEPTCGLDAETEASFLADLRAACGTRTVIVATHAELPEGATDAIFTLRNGRIA